MVGLFNPAERITYKSGPSRTAGFAQLIWHFASIGELRHSEYPRWVELTRIVADPKPGDLKDRLAVASPANQLHVGLNDSQYTDTGSLRDSARAVSNG
jgi:hypothetical protein